MFTDLEWNREQQIYKAVSIRMSRNPMNEFVVLNDRKFEELCAVLGVKQQCVLDPDKKVIEKAFRRNALKCHPDKGGDPVVFKKLNDAYLKLIGHIQKVGLEN